MYVQYSIIVLSNICFVKTYKYCITCVFNLQCTVWRVFSLRHAVVVQFLPEFLRGKIVRTKRETAKYIDSQQDKLHQVLKGQPHNFIRKARALIL